MIEGKVLVTGATGFLGGRLIEKLYAEHRCEVRVLVRNLTRAVNIARFPVEFVVSDICGDLERAALGCHTIFHCAYGNGGSESDQSRVTVQGTENVVAAALQAKARLIHVSTMAVYGTAAPEIHEGLDYGTSQEIYPVTKIAAEKAVLKGISQGLEAVILQPSIIYGPFSPFWTEWFVRRMQQGPVVLPSGGRGFANLLYIDDAADSLLAAAMGSACGQRLLVSGQAVSWAQFFGYYAAMLGVEGFREMPEAEIRVRRDRGRLSLLRFLFSLRHNQELRRGLLSTRELYALRQFLRRNVPTAVKTLGRNLLGLKDSPRSQVIEKPEKVVDPFYPDESLLRQFTTQGRIRSHSGSKISLSDGMERTQEWLRWAQIL